MAYVTQFEDQFDDLIVPVFAAESQPGSPNIGCNALLDTGTPQTLIEEAFALTELGLEPLGSEPVLLYRPGPSGSVQKQLVQAATVGLNVSLPGLREGISVGVDAILCESVDDIPADEDGPEQCRILLGMDFIGRLNLVRLVDADSVTLVLSRAVDAAGAP